MKIYNAQRLWDYDIESIGIYSSLKQAVDDLLSISGSYDCLFIEEQKLDSMFEGKRVWECEEGVETFYA